MLAGAMAYGALTLAPCGNYLHPQVVGTRYAHMAATYHGAKGTAAGH